MDKDIEYKMIKDNILFTIHEVRYRIAKAKEMSTVIELSKILLNLCEEYKEYKNLYEKERND